MKDLSSLSQQFKDRFLKNLKRLKPWAKRHGLEAFRLFDHDLPQIPFTIDRFQKAILFQDRRVLASEMGPAYDVWVDELSKWTFETCQQQLDHVYEIVMQRRTPLDLTSEQVQNDPRTRRSERIVAKEGKLKYWIDLYSQTDVGLFFDQRTLRMHLQKSKPSDGAGKRPNKHPSRCLNLFSYTGTTSVAAAIGGYQVTSVDLSATYTDWAKANFELNLLPVDQHDFYQMDVFSFLTDMSASRQGPRYDLIVLDPPTFTNSKRMELGSFDLIENHGPLLEKTLKLLAPGGKLLFFVHARGFKLAPYFKNDFRDVSSDYRPFDYGAHHPFLTLEAIRKPR